MGGGCRVGVGFGGGGVRVDVNEELKFLGKFKKKIFFWGGGSGGLGQGGAGCRVRGRVWGVKVDVNEELKFLGKFTKKKLGGGGGGSVAEGVRWGGGSGWWGGGGVRVDVNAMLGVGVMWGMGDVNQE